jgi:hypothetical protein
LQGAEKMQRIAFLLLLCFPFPTFAQAPIPDALMKAKTAFVVNESAKAKDYDSLYNELNKWGRFELVQDKQKADIIIVLSAKIGEESAMVAPGGGVFIGQSETKHYIRITKASDNSLLWSDAADHPHGNPKKLVSNLKKRIENQR